MYTGIWRCKPKTIIFAVPINKNFCFSNIVLNEIQNSSLKLKPVVSDKSTFQEKLHNVGKSSSFRNDYSTT